MKYLFRQLDLIFVVAWTAALFLAIYGTPDLRVARVVLGLPWAFFVPGYALVSGLFPREDDLDVVERAGVSIAISIGLVPLLGLIVNYTRWGVSLDPMLLSLSWLTIASVVVAAARRSSLSATEKAFSPFARQQMAEGLSHSRVPAALLLVVALFFVISLSVTIYFVSNDRARFTEFYVLNADRQAEGYPRDIRLGEEVRLVLGVINREGGSATYSIETRLADQSVSVTEAFTLDEGIERELEVTIRPSRTGDDQSLEFILSRDGSATPYRRLRLLVDVTPADAPATRARLAVSR